MTAHTAVPSRPRLGMTCALGTKLEMTREGDRMQQLEEAWEDVLE